MIRNFSDSANGKETKEHKKALKWEKNRIIIGKDAHCGSEAIITEKTKESIYTKNMKQPTFLSWMTLYSIWNNANAFQTITTNGLYRIQQSKYTKQLLSPNDVVSQVKDSIPSIDLSPLEQLSRLNLDNFEFNQFSQWPDQLSPLVNTISTNLPKESVWIFPTIGLFSILYALSFPKDNFRRGYDPYERGKYDPYVAKEYYAKHPMLVLVRSLQLIRLSNKFVFSILIDKYITKKEEQNRPKR